MAGKGDVNGARQPTSSAHAFDGGIATKDVEPVWQTEALPGWVVNHLIPLLTAGQSWPKGSESKLWELRVEYVKLMNLLIGTLDPTATTVQILNSSLQSPAKPAIFKRLAKLSDDKAGVVAKAQESFSYAKMVDNFARETQYSKLSVNVAFWVAVVAAFIALIAAGFSPLASLLLRSVGTAGATRIALIMERLALVASRSGTVAASSRITKLAGATAGNKFFNAALAAELVEEITEEVFIDAFAQYQQIKMGTRDTWDWKKIKAAAIGAGAGAVAGTKLGGPMSRFANNLPGISRLNRIAGDNGGVGNAFLRFPGRALNTGLNNMVASPAGSIVANYAVYDQFSLPGAEGFYGGFLGGAGRTNTISPFNPSVAGAIINPMSTLSGVFDSAMAAQQGSADTMGSPTVGDSPAPAGPRPGSADGTVAPVVPPQRQAIDVTGPSTGATRRDSTATVIGPADQESGRKGTQTAPTPDIITPDANRTNRTQQDNEVKVQQDLPAPQQEEELDTQAQGPVSQPAAPTAPPAGQQSAPTSDRAPAEASGAPASAPEQSGTANPATAPQQSSTPEPASAPEATTAPEPAGTPENAGEHHTAHTPEPTGSPQDAGTPGTVTTSETVTTVTSTTPSVDRQPAVTPAPAPQAPNAPSLIARLIGTIRRTGNTPATAIGRPGSTHGSPDPGSGFIPDGRTGLDDLTATEAHDSFVREVIPEDFGEAVTGIVWEPGGQLIVQHATLGDLHFMVQVGPVDGGYLGETKVQEVLGNAEDPHVMTLVPRVADDQVARLVLHEISDVIQHRLESTHTHTPGQATRDECVTGRRNELRFLQRKQRAAVAAGNTQAAEKLASEVAAVERDLDVRTRPSPSIDDLINWTATDELAALGILGEPEHLGSNVFKVTLTNGSTALLLDHSTSRERDLQLLVTHLANRLGLVGRARAAGDRHILINWTPTETSPGLLGTREAVLAGYLIALADMTPLVTKPTLHVLTSGTLLLAPFLRQDAFGELGWGSNPLSWSDLQALGTMLEAARADFAEIGLLPAFNQIMDRHHLIVWNAAGMENVVTATPARRLLMADFERPRAVDEDVRRLKANLQHGIVSRRESALGPVVTFADGSQALELPLREAPEVLVRALVRRVLGLAGPAVHLDHRGNVYRTLGSDRLQASAATGIDHVIDGSQQPGGTTTVVFNDGSQALRREFPTRAAADEYEARLEEAYDVTDGRPGSHRADPYVIYEEIVIPSEPDAETETRLADRALYTFLSLGKPMDHATLRRLLDANPMLVRFGQAYDWDFRAGAPVLSARDVTDLATRFTALRSIFDTLSLSSRHEWILSTLSRFIGSENARLISLPLSEGLTTGEHHAPAWQPAPEPGPILGELLQDDHLWQVNTRNQTDVITRADAELAELPNAEGHVFARVPGGVLPADIQPGSEFTVDTLLDGVDNADLLSESPHGVRVTILASDYVPVGDLSGHPHRALFRAGARFAVTAVLTTDNGEPHYFLTQQPTGDRTGPVITPTIGLTPARAQALAEHAHPAVSGTTAGIRIHSDGHEALNPSPRVVPGTCIVQGRFSERGTLIDGRFVTVEEIAALLLNSPDLQPGQTILLADADAGTTTIAQRLAHLTGRIVTAANGPVETTSRGDLRVGDIYGPPGHFSIFPPGDTSGAIAELLSTWLAPALAATSDSPPTAVSGLRPTPHVDAGLSEALDESANRASAPPLSSRHRNLILEHRREVVAGIWYRDENSLVMPTADPRLLRLMPGIIVVAIAGDGTSFLIGPERLSVADLATMLAYDPRLISNPKARLRILGGETARDQAVLQELADLTGRTVLAGNEIVYVGADRRAHTAAIQQYSADGRPIFSPNDDDQWLHARPAAPVAAPPSPVQVRPRATAPRRALPPGLVEAAMAADPASWIRLGSGEDGRVDVLVLEDGTTIARKIMTDGRKAEILGSIVGQRIGANVPVVVAHPTNRHAVLMDYVPGLAAPRGSDLNVRRGAMLLELLDILIINNDRHKGNLVITDDGVTGIDHGRAFMVDRDGKGVLDPIHFRGNFLELGADDRFYWIDNPLSSQDVEFLTEIMVSLRPDYQKYGFDTAYNVALDRLYQIGIHATGQTSLIAPASHAPAEVQHRFGWEFDEAVGDATPRSASAADPDRTGRT
ncbi:hypothetical protein GCM10022419_121210 [Nonomuraea rosea]|uniref:Outer membrane channel protein CpnT-like N-terminal domain-containing protein n=2 Tax=Nonomuraea rosea TaxID=638574 RepID=A0ABP6ZQ48_9ACTN